MLRQVLAGTSQCNLINWAFLSTDSKLTLSQFGFQLSIGWSFGIIKEINEVF